jgi:hypothetical protein
MSYLRQIMQKLANSDAKRGRRMATDSGELLKLHIDDYQGKLEACTPGMLQYEWAWLKEHLESLELCQAHEAMGEELGGQENVVRLLAKTRQFQTALEEELNKRMLHPARHPHPIHPGDHAWDVDDDSMRKIWDF